MRIVLKQAREIRGVERRAGELLEVPEALAQSLIEEGAAVARPPHLPDELEEKTDEGEDGDEVTA